MNNDKQKETEAVQVARITRNQAIVVAFITAIGGFITALLTLHVGLFNSDSTKTVQHWGRIEEVRLGNDISVKNIDRVRITAQVNGASYSFPTNTIWAKLGKDLAGERFPLPVGARTFRIKFTGFGKTAGGTGAVRFLNRDIVELKLSHLPLKNLTQSLKYKTSELDLAADGLIIIYSVE